MAERRDLTGVSHLDPYAVPVREKRQLTVFRSLLCVLQC